MSQVIRAKIECPHCHQQGEFEQWLSVNVDLDPELKDKIFSEELFTYHCPHCGESIGVPVGTLYHDMTHGFMIFFDFFKPEDYDYRPLRIPTEFGTQKEYRLRGVFGLPRFKEKIRILEEGLDDIAIERQKYIISHIFRPEIANNGYELFYAITEGPSDDFPHGTIDFVYYDEKEKDNMILKIPIENYYEHKLSCELDPRMKIEGCMCIDEGWMAKQMSEE